MLNSEPNFKRNVVNFIQIQIQIQIQEKKEVEKENSWFKELNEYNFVRTLKYCDF